jgi:protein-S-isoprenylcysteine O-methyltransferase Ste14
MKERTVLKRLGQAAAVGVTVVIVVLLAGPQRLLGTAHGIIYLLLWSVWLMTTMLWRRRGAATPHTRVGQITTAFSYIAMPALLVVPPLDYRLVHALGPDGGALSWLGLALFAVGIALQVAAMRTLREHFTVRMGVRPGQSLINSGPYRLVRHPGYLSYMLSLAGVGLALNSVLTLFVLAGAAVFLVWYVRHEETMLEQELEGYREYEQKVRFRLLPGIW